MTHMPFLFPFSRETKPFSDIELIILFMVRVDFPIDEAIISCVAFGLILRILIMANSSKVTFKGPFWHFEMPVL